MLNPGCKVVLVQCASTVCNSGGALCDVFLLVAAAGSMSANGQLQQLPGKAFALAAAHRP